MTKNYFFSKYYSHKLFNEPMLSVINTSNSFKKKNIALNLINSLSRLSINVHHLNWCLSNTTCNDKYYSYYLKSFFQSNIYYTSFNNSIEYYFLNSGILLDKNDYVLIKNASDLEALLYKKKKITMYLNYNALKLSKYLQKSNIKILFLLNHIKKQKPA